MSDFNWKNIGGREIYDTLPTKLKEEMKLYWRTKTKIKQLNKKKDKLNSQIKEIVEELKQLRKQQTQSLPNIRYVNKNFIPTISFTLDKRSNTYLCVIKIKGTSKSFYLGKEDKIKKDIKDKLNEDWSDYSINKLKFSLKIIIEKVIMDFIDVTNISSLWDKSDLNFENVLIKYKNSLNG
jgi:hypothetical protein